MTVDLRILARLFPPELGGCSLSVDEVAQQLKYCVVETTAPFRVFCFAVIQLGNDETTVRLGDGYSPWTGEFELADPECGKKATAMALQCVKTSAELRRRQLRGELFLLEKIGYG